MSNEELIEECRRRALRLLSENLSQQGILAAHPGRRARARGYTAVFGRDASICAIGMAHSGEARLARAAARGLATLARHQAANGQIPNYVARGREPDFWYLGCIDATLWWLIAVATLRRKRSFGATVKRALRWLEAQEHPRIFLLQQNEASDWADVMPRSGFVLYTNALWYQVKRLYRLPRAADTRRNFQRLFDPRSASGAADRRAQLLAQYVRRPRRPDLYLSFVNFSFWGDEGDVLGNLLAILSGLADRARSRRILRALERARVNEPYPVRVVCDPVRESDPLWRAYMARHRQNLPWQYHNGGVWPFAGGFWVAALAQIGEHAKVRRELARLALANALGGWQFNEWLHGRSGKPRGVPLQSWNAAAFLMAHLAVSGRAGLFRW